MREVILKSTELGRLSEEVLGRGGHLCFKARGSSMVPFIRNGDILFIQPVKASSLVVGDVALYRIASDRLIAHRVVGRERQNGREILKMRGDALSGSYSNVFAQQVLGRVSSIKRGKRLIRLDRFDQRLMALLWIRIPPLSPSLFRPLQTVKSSVAFCMRLLQTFKPYRVLIKKLIGANVHYRVAACEDSQDLSKLCGYERFPEVVDPVGTIDRHFDNMEGSGYTLMAFVRERVAGAAVIRRFTNSRSLYTDWWLLCMIVRTRYRGAGIGEGMVNLAIEKASEDGAEKLNLLVYENNTPALNLYKKMGFTKTPGYRLSDQLNKDSAEENHRIIMSRLLQSSPNRELK